VDGYRLTQPTTCRNGKLTLSICEPKSCPNPPVPDHGQVGADWKDPLPSGESSRVACEPGYTPTNGGKYTCDKGVLSPTVECLPSACANPPLPDHGIKGADWKDPLPSGATIRVACDPGYTPTNGGKYTCDKGVLSPPMVECEPSACANPPLPDHGLAGADWKDPLPSGATTRVACEPGYTPTNGGM
jgi:hypothetical protein